MYRKLFVSIKYEFRFGEFIVRLIVAITLVVVPVFLGVSEEENKTTNVSRAGGGDKNRGQ